MLLRVVKDEIIMHATLHELSSPQFKVYHSVYHRPLASMMAHVNHWGVPRETFRRSVHQLIASDWMLFVDDPHRGKLLVPWMPVRVEERVLDELRRRLPSRRFLGESLLRALLDLCIDDRRYEDNATTEWLVTGDGSGQLELDRFYVDAGVAFEFQGAQHFRAGDLSSEAEFIAQRTRDNIKIGLCTRNGVRLIEVTPFDLSVQTLRQKIGHALPWFPVFEDRPLCRGLHQLCHRYMNNVARITQRDATLKGTSL